MTVANEDGRSGPYNGNDSTTVFAYDFKVLDESHLVVTLTSSAGVEIVQTISTHYTVSGVGNDGGGNVTVLTAPATGETLTITRSVPKTQLVDLQNRGGVQPQTLETMTDRVVQITQDLQEELDRTPKFQVSSDLSSFDPTIPAPVASKAIVIKSDNTGFELVDEPSASQAAAAASASAAATSASNASTSETNAAASAAAASTSETNAATSATNAANSAASAAASAQGFSGVELVTASSKDVETTDARKYYQVDASSNTVSINLPSIGTGNDGLSYTIEVLDVSNTITLVRDGTDTINGVAGNYTGLVEVGQVIQIIADDGTPDNWIVVQASALKVDGSTVELSGRTIQVKDDGITPAKVSGSVNAQTGTTYTLVLGDARKTVTMDNASANTLTIPTNASVAFSTGDRIDVWMKGAGVTTITGDTGVTVNGVSAGSGDLAQYGACSLLKVGTDTWLAGGITVA